MRTTPLAIAAVLSAAESSPAIRGRERGAPPGGRNLRAAATGAERRLVDKDRALQKAEACNFCPGGVSDTELTLPGPEEATCGEAADYASALSADDEFCPTVLMGESVCCPKKPVLFDGKAGTCAFCAGGIPDVDVRLPGKGKTPTCGQAAEMAASLAGDDDMCPAVQSGEKVCCPEGDGDGDEGAAAAEDPDAPAPAPPNSCPFCDGGLVDPTLLLPGENAPNCGDTKGFAENLPASDPLCPTVQTGQLVCCPDDVGEVFVPGIGIGPALPPAATTTESPPSQPAVDADVGPCSCSPLRYEVTLDLSRDCATDDLDGGPGIGLTFCFLAEASVGSDDRRLVGKSGKGSFLRELRDGADGGGGRFRALQPQQFGAMDPDAIRVVSVQFLEFDTSGELIVINQDDTYGDVDLADGDVLTFDSISSNLVPGVAASDQQDYFPGGAQITMRGKIATGDGEIVVSNRLTWSYTNSCDEVPIGGDEEIGWATIVSSCFPIV